MTDEEDPESQDSHGWLHTGKSPPKGSGHVSGQYNYQGRQTSNLEVDKESYLGPNGNSGEGMLMGESKGKSQLMENCNSYGENTAIVDVLQEINELAEKVQNSSFLGTNVSIQINQTDSLADWGFMEVDGISTTEAVKLSELSESSGKISDPAHEIAIQQEAAPSQTAMEENAVEIERSACCIMEEEVVASLASNVSITTTRHSSRLKEDGISMMAKAMNMKNALASKGNPSCTNLNSSTSNQVEVISKICGINLGDDVKRRVANISLIQAQEDAVKALIKAKNKILLSSDTVQQQSLSFENVGTSIIEVTDL